MMSKSIPGLLTVVILVYALMASRTPLKGQPKSNTNPMLSVVQGVSGGVSRGDGLSFRLNTNVWGRTDITLCIRIKLVDNCNHGPISNSIVYAMHFRLWKLILWTKRLALKEIGKIKLQYGWPYFYLYWKMHNKHVNDCTHPHIRVFLDTSFHFKVVDMDTFYLFKNIGIGYI